MRAEKWLAQQTPEFRGYIDAFCAGINAARVWQHPDVLGLEVRQVLLIIPAIDIIKHEQHFYNFEFVASRNLMESSGARGGAESSARLGAVSERFGEHRRRSCRWFLTAGPSHLHTRPTAKHMLLMNPHLAWGGEQTYFEVQLSAPGINLYGATQIGVPALRFVMSDRLAITNTVNTNNGHLLYRITEAAPVGGYMFDGKVLAYEKAAYPIKIKMADGSFRTETAGGAPDCPRSQ